MFWCFSTCTKELRELPYLPDELMLNCLARISRSHYPSLSLVCKRFRSLLASKELYNTRKLLGTTESGLYLLSYGPSSHFFRLCQRPSRTILNRLSLKNLIVPLLSSPSNPCVSTFIDSDYMIGITTFVGSDIYIIGGYINFELSSRVFVLNCLSHTWHEAPSMRLIRMHPIVTVVDEIIYVMDEFSTSVECFDPKANIWEFLPNPDPEICWTRIMGSSAINGNLHLHLFGDKNVVYKPKENKWYEVGLELLQNNLHGIYFSLPTTQFFGTSTCLVDNVLYSYNDGEILWQKISESSSRVLKGCEEISNFKPSNFGFLSMVNYGGKIVLFWERNVFSFTSDYKKEKKKKIWCAKVTLEKRNNGQEIRGRVNHCGVVLQVPKSFSFDQVIVTTL